MLRAALALVAATAVGLLAAGARPYVPTAGKSVTIVPGATVSQPFGCTTFAFEPVAAACPGGHFHSGVDLAAPAGTPALAAASGTAWAASEAGCGNFVVLDLGGGWTAVYCHLLAAMVRSGERVIAGQEVGEVGSTGNSTGPHLHFEVRHDGVPLDPLAWLGVDTRGGDCNSQGGKASKCSTR
jgi:murein DD-endopeptidase MepM/ murein hydrolase activator NlpD